MHARRPAVDRIINFNMDPEPEPIQEDLLIERIEMALPAAPGEKEAGVMSVKVPQNRVSPLKKNWEKICEIVIEKCKLNIRMNPAKKCVDLRESENTTDSTVLQKAADFLRAFALGFALEDAVALLRIDDLFV
jgi:RNA-binding protein PNO1